MSGTTVAGINKICLALAYSYVAGVILYWLSVRLPFLRNKRKFKDVIVDRIRSIGGHLSNMNIEFRPIDPEHLLDPNISDVNTIMSMFTTSRWSESCRVPIHNLYSNVTEAFYHDYQELHRIVSSLINDYKSFLSTDQLLLLEALRSTDLNTLFAVSSNYGYQFSDIFYERVLQPSYHKLLVNYNELEKTIKG